MADVAIEQVVLAVLTSVLGSQPGLDMPLVQAGLDSLGKTYTKCQRCFSAGEAKLLFCERFLRKTQVVTGLTYSRQEHDVVCHTGAVEVRNELCRMLGLELPSTAVFDYPTVSTLCKFISTLSAQMPGTSLPNTLSRVEYI